MNQEPATPPVADFLQVQAYLRQYLGMDNTLKQRKAEIEELAKIAGQPQGAFAQEVNQQKEKLLREVRALLHQQEEIRQTVSQLKNPDERNVIEKRYFTKSTWKKTSRELAISLRTAHRHHRAGLSHLVLPEPRSNTTTA